MDGNFSTGDDVRTGDVEVGREEKGGMDGMVALLLVFALAFGVPMVV